MKIAALLLVTTMLTTVSFKESQLQHSRVKTAYTEKESVVKKYFTEKGLSQDGFNLFVRAFKKEQILEVWIKEKNKTTFTLLTTFDFCTTSGSLGPKRKEGDLQIPEGAYQINHFNPQSNFYLSLGISYPNASDKILSDKQKPGGDIYIHGNCVTIGCIPITDDKIKELYVLAVEARNSGQEKIPVHIFPCVMNEDGIQYLNTAFSSDKSRLTFWENLKIVFNDFDQTHSIRPAKVNKSGQYFY